MRAVVIGVFFGALCTTSAWAANYTYSTTINLSNASYPTPGSSANVDFTLPSGQPSFQLNTGDTISGTINFNGTLNFSGPSGDDWLEFYLSPGNSVSSNNSFSENFTLLGVTGLLNSPNPETGTASGPGIGILYNATAGIAGTSPVSFTGISYSATIINEVDTGLSYSPEALTVFDPDQNVSITVAPEPQTWPLLLSGVTCLVLLRRKRAVNHDGCR